MATSVAAAEQVLREAGTPLTIDEIWDRVRATGAWRTEGRSPRQTLAVQVARATEGYQGSRPTRAKLFVRLADGRYTLLNK